MQSQNAPNALGAAEQALSRAGTLSGVMEIVGHYARELTGADGATFVLKEGDNCFYAEEDAIGPLWKGRRFPQTSCISGWVMMNAKPAIVENVLEDPRIPTEVYRPTFVRSLAMVPVGVGTPMAAIGAYWARSHRPTQQQLDALTALAKSVVETMARVR